MDLRLPVWQDPCARDGLHDERDIARPPFRGVRATSSQSNCTAASRGLIHADSGDSALVEQPAGFPGLAREDLRPGCTVVDGSSTSSACPAPEQAVAAVSAGIKWRSTPPAGDACRPERAIRRPLVAAPLRGIDDAAATLRRGRPRAAPWALPSGASCRAVAVRSGRRSTRRSTCALDHERFARTAFEPCRAAQLGNRRSLTSWELVLDAIRGQWPRQGAWLACWSVTSSDFSARVRLPTAARSEARNRRPTVDVREVRFSRRYPSVPASLLAYGNARSPDHWRGLRAEARSARPCLPLARRRPGRPTAASSTAAAASRTPARSSRRSPADPGRAPRR